MNAPPVLLVLAAHEVAWLHGVNAEMAAHPAMANPEGPKAARSVISAICRDVPWGAYIGRGQVNAPGLWQVRLTEHEAWWLDGLIYAARILADGSDMPDHEAFDTAREVGGRIAELIEDQMPALRTASIMDWADRFSLAPVAPRDEAEPPVCPWCGRRMSACQCDPGEAPF